jgi:hypothetical protein
VYGLIGRNELKAVKIGDRLVITRQAIDEFLKSRPAAKIKPPRARRRT